MVRNKRSFSRLLRLFKQKNAANPLWGESPEVYIVAHEIMGSFNWGTHYGVPKHFCQFDQRSLAETLGISLFKINKAVKRCLEIIFDRIEGWKPFSRAQKTIVRLKDEFLQLLEPHAITVAEAPQSVEPQAVDHSEKTVSKTVDPSALLYKGKHKRVSKPQGAETQNKHAGWKPQTTLSGVDKKVESRLAKLTISILEHYKSARNTEGISAEIAPVVMGPYFDAVLAGYPDFLAFERDVDEAYSKRGQFRSWLHVAAYRLRKRLEKHPMVGELLDYVSRYERAQ